LEKAAVENSRLHGADAVYTISQLTRLIKTELEAAFPNPVWVEGEISNFSRAHSGHLYFDLKDKDSQLRSVMWRAYASRVPFGPESGQQVVCKGQINVYERRGQYQFQVEVMEPKGKGALQLAFEQLREKLHMEGLFAEEIKKRLPALPRKIGVVTSPRGAALVDILRTLERRFARLQILIYPVKVQGDGSAEEIVSGIDYFSSREDVDVLIVGRGGGSLEDLWAFNDEGVARAIHRCPIPVISAVGHEVDFTIADFVADIRASTPTAAAEMVIEEEESLQLRVNILQKRLGQSLLLAAQGQKNRVLQLAHHPVFQDFRLRVFSLFQGVDELEQRAAHCIRRQSVRINEIRSRAQLLDERVRSRIKGQMQAHQALWERLCAELHTLSPLSVLKKGYTVCWAADGRTLIRKVEDVRIGENMTVSFHRGEFQCQVSGVDKTRTVQDRYRKAKVPGDGDSIPEDRSADERNKR
jgi:exodeoxyribonuclease VII large subunit